MLTTPEWQTFQIINKNTLVDADDLADDADIDSSCGCSSHQDKSCSTNACINYATLTECISCSQFCQNRRFQSSKAVKVTVKSVGEKGFGLFPLEDVRKGQFVGEYVGELISAKELQRRSVRFSFTFQRLIN